MEKRTLFAIVLAMLILLAWSAFMSKTTPPSSPLPYKQQFKAEAIVAKPEAKTSEKPAPSLFTFNQGQYDVILIESEAAIKEVIFKNYQSYRFPLQYGFSLNEQGLIFRKTGASADSLTFTASDAYKKIIKRFIFHNTNYTIDLDIKTLNTSNQRLPLNTPLVLGVLNFSGDQTKARFQDVTVAQIGKISHPNAHKNADFGNLQFLGIRDRYFCSIIEPPDNTYSAFVKKITPQESEFGLNMPDIVLVPGQQIEQKFRIYLGPQELSIIKQANPQWTAVMYYGMFSFISEMLLQLVEFLYRFVHNWGLAIIILSILIYFLLYPLSLKQMRSMKEMQALQPKVEQLKKAYKDNPQKLNKEIMNLYREHKVNPLGGCLPLVLQIPIFFALYQALIRSIALKGAHFLWIKDLSEPDRAFIMPFSIPMLGNEINILPILMVVVMFIQQKITTTSAAMGQQEQQKLMLIFMPLLFLFIFYHMPSGLVLYWLVNSLLMLIYQFRISRLK
ncbi:MAG: membrane protein insertase YidC [Candidatus Omnitrophica bacterium]|nr:membrane protein insertase YidC [Candidatus Omnitrophota bacterium]